MEKRLDIRGERPGKKGKPNLLYSEYSRLNDQRRLFVKRLTGGLNPRGGVQNNLRELPPYGPVIKLSWPIKAIIIIVIVVFSFFYGSAFALFVPFLMWPILIPPIALSALVFWSLPDFKNSPTMYLQALFFIFFVALLMWPNYLALAIPGFPRLTLVRMVDAPLSLLVFLCLAVSKQFRRSLIEASRASFPTAHVIFAFTLVQIVSIIFSANKGSSINALVNVFTTWITCYLSAAFIMQKKGVAEKFSGLLCLLAILLSGLTFWEQLLHHLPWQGHVPSFLQISDPVVDRIIAGTARQGKLHRDQATFTTSLGLSEFLALVMPFLLHFAFSGLTRLGRITAFCAVPLVLAATLLTQARTGLLGIAIAGCGFSVGRIFLYWYRHRASFIASLLLYLSPFGALAALVVALVVPAVRIRLLGGGEEQLSNGGRSVQMHMGLPKVFLHPWGYGIGQGAETLGWTNAAGLLSIDSYPLRLALEYGLLGLLLWVGMLASGIWSGYRCLIDTDGAGHEKMLLLPIIIALLSYFAMKVNFAQEDNQPIIYALLGTAAAICQSVKSGTAPNASFTQLESVRISQARSDLTPPNRLRGS